MGKMILCFVSSLLLFSTLFVGAANLEEIKNNLENAQEIRDGLIDETTRDNFLHKTWIELLGESKLKGILEVVERFFMFFDGVWEIVLGVSFSLSWAFMLTFMFWLLLVLVGYNLMPLIKFFSSNLFMWISFFAYFVLISSIRISLTFTNIILSSISKINSLRMQFLFVIIIFFSLVFCIVFSNRVSSMVKIWKKERRVQDLEKKGAELDKFKEDFEKSKRLNQLKKEEEEIKEEVRSDFEGLSQE